jgi:tetratricopeptide (TPR) repeat protein
MVSMRGFFLLLILLFIISSAVPVHSASNEKEVFVIAQRAFEDGFYDVSLRYLEQLLKEFPQTTKFVEAKLLEGQCYFFKKQYVKAFSVFQEIVQRNEYKDVTLFWLGETYLKVGDYPKAQEQYKQLIETAPGSLYAPQAYYSLGWSYFEKGNYEQAKKSFQKLIELFPSNNLSEDAAFKLGECDYNAGQYEGAIFAFSKYAQDFPSSRRLFDANFNIAEAYYYLEQYDKAAEAYKKAQGLSKDPKSALSALVGIGWSFLKSEKYDDAMKAFDEAQALAKANGISEEDVILGKASLFSAREKQSDAVASYSELIDRFPQSPRLPEAYLGRANARYLLNDYPGAISDYRKLIDLFGADAQMQKVVEKARFGLAWTYLKNGSLEQSIESFRGVLEKTESRTVKVSALTQIGDAYQEAGQIDKAIETYDKILKELPDTPYSDYVQYQLGVALIKVNKIEAALLAFQALQANFPKSKFISASKYYMGVAYFKQRDWTSAVDILGTFVKSVPPDNEFSSESRYLMGLALFNLKQFDKALAVFNEMLKLYPNQVMTVQNAQLGLAKTKYEQGATKEALALFKEIAFKYPKTDAALESLIWMGQHAMSSGIYERAAEYYTQALTDFPEHEKKSLVHFELGRAYQLMGKLDKALEHYRQVESRVGSDLAAKAKIAVADIFSQELDPALALETYRNIIATSPEFERDALVKIAQIDRKGGKIEDAVKAYQDALSRKPGVSRVTNAEIQFLIGDTYEAANDFDKAVEEYFKLPYIYSKELPWVVKAYLRIAKIYENKEDWDKALTAYGKVVELKVDESKFAQERTTWINDNRNKK